MHLFRRTAPVILLAFCVLAASGMQSQLNHQQRPINPQIVRIASQLAPNDPLGLVLLASIQKIGLSNTRDERGATVLHTLAEMGWERGVALWIVLGNLDQISAVDHAGQTPSDYAQRAGHPELALALH